VNGSRSARYRLIGVGVVMIVDDETPLAAAFNA
jgi:hypothetical protein